MDALAEQPALFDVRISPKIQRHPNYVSLKITPHQTRVHVEQIQKAIQGDKTLQLFLQQMFEGWLEHSRSLLMILGHS